MHAPPPPAGSGGHQRRGRIRVSLLDCLYFINIMELEMAHSLTVCTKSCPAGFRCWRFYRTMFIKVLSAIIRHHYYYYYFFLFADMSFSLAEESDNRRRDCVALVLNAAATPVKRKHSQVVVLKSPSHICDRQSEFISTCLLVIWLLAQTFKAHYSSIFTFQRTSML